MRVGILTSALLFILSGAAVQHAEAAVGRIEGMFGVSADGAATYTIPIWVPPGPRVVQPELALTYSSLRQWPIGSGLVTGGTIRNRTLSTRLSDR